MVITIGICPASLFAGKGVPSVLQCHFDDAEGNPQPVVHHRRFVGLEAGIRSKSRRIRGEITMSLWSKTGSSRPKSFAGHRLSGPVTTKLARRTCCVGSTTPWRRTRCRLRRGLANFSPAGVWISLWSLRTDRRTPTSRPSHMTYAWGPLCLKQKSSIGRVVSPKQCIC